jgi:hypothetical protein
VGSADDLAARGRLLEALKKTNEEGRKTGTKESDQSSLPFLFSCFPY